MKDAPLRSFTVNAFDVGQTVGGKYQIQRVIGRGGMGLVVEARQLALGERVAIKCLVPELVQHPEASRRFLREARMTFALRSPNIVSVLDVGHTDSGLPYIVMEYLDGEDLGARLQRLGRLTPQDAVEVVFQAASGVAHAHSQGIIHRDLKPSNLLCVCDANGELLVKVVDFGISKLSPESPLGTDSLVNTQTATVLGSPLYMAPEQLQSAKHLDEGCDIWALGVILFELLAGRPPFLGKSITEVAINVATQALPELFEFRRDVSPQLQAVVVRCLQKRRAERYLTVEELIAALQDCAESTSFAKGNVGAAALDGAVIGNLPTGTASVTRDPMSALSARVPTLTIDGSATSGALTHSPVSNTQAPMGFVKGRTQIITAAGAVTVALLVGRWALHGPANVEGARTLETLPSGETNMASGEMGTAADHPGVVTVTTSADRREATTSAMQVANVAVVDIPPVPSTEANRASAAASNGDATATQKPAARAAPSAKGTTTPTGGFPLIGLAAASSSTEQPRVPSAATRSASSAPQKPTAPCVPYYMRNGVRVFNDACILQREAQKGRIRSEPARDRNP